MNSSVSPLISVLLPVYNMEEYIEDAIHSVLRDDYAELELLVIDDGSTDKTVQRVKKFTQPEGVYFDQRVKVIEKANGGKSTAVNMGLKECQGQFMMIMDADDELSKQGLSCRSEALREVGNECSMVIGGFEVFETNESVGKRPLNDLTNSAAQLKRKFYLAFKTPFHLNSCLISRPLFEKVGLFDASLRRCQDIDYSMRCLTHVDELKLSSAIVYRYRKHRGEKKDRIRLRLKTIRHRITVFWKNIEGPKKPFGVVCGLGMDMLKLVYEMFGNYKN